jgi:hypothetical protein
MEDLEPEGCGVARSELLRQPQILEAQLLILVLLRRKGSGAREDAKAQLVIDVLHTLLIVVVRNLLQQIALPQGSEFLLQIFGLVAHAAHLPSAERPPSSALEVLGTCKIRLSIVKLKLENGLSSKGQQLSSS